MVRRRKPRVAVALFVILATPAAADEIASARGAYDRGEFEAAAKSYRGIVAREPSNEAARVGLIRSLLGAGDVEVGLAAAVEAEKLFPSSAPILSAAGDLRFRRAELSEASVLYRRSASADPSHARAYFGLAKLHETDFNRRSALASYRKAHELDPRDPEIILAYAHVLSGPEELRLLVKYMNLDVPGRSAESIDDARDHLEYHRGMGDRPTWVLQGTPRAATLPLAIAGNNEGYLLSARINGGKPVTLWLDTGAHGVFIHRSLAEKLGVQVLSASDVKGLGDGKHHASQMGLARSIQFGDIGFRDCSIEMSERKLLSGAQGLIGTNVFEQFLITLDSPARELRLAPLPPIEGQRYDNPKGWDELDRTSMPELHDFVPVRTWRGDFLVETLVNDTATGYFILDTGANSNLISTELARKVTTVDRSRATVRGLSGTVDHVGSARKVVLRVGRFQQRNDGMVAISFKESNRARGFEISGLLGHPMLRQLVTTLDYRDGLIKLSVPGAEE